MKLSIAKYKEYFPFIASILMCFIAIIFLSIIYFNWDKTVEPEEYLVEVSLPIINWQGYGDLSKQYEDDSIQNIN